MNGIFDSCSVSRLSTRPAIAKLCPSLKSISDSTRRVDSAGIKKPEIVEGIGEIQRADFRLHVQVNQAARQQCGREIQPHAEFLELNRDSRETTARSALHDGKRKFAAGQKAGVFSGRREQVRLGQDFENVVLLQAWIVAARLMSGRKRKIFSRLLTPIARIHAL